MDYSWQDADAGLCAPHMVGTPKHVAAGNGTALSDPKTLESIFEHLGGLQAFKQWAKLNASQVYPLMIKMGLTKLAKEEHTELPALNTLTSAELKTYSTSDLKRMLLASLDICTKAEADALKGKM